MPTIATTHHAASALLAANDTTPPQPWTRYRNRPEPALGERVRVYRNLNNGQYSVRALSGPHKGLVLGYAPAIGLADIHLHVSEKTRDTVVRKRERNIHAWSEGVYLGCADEPPRAVRQQRQLITYFPFIRSFFFLRTRPDQPVTAIDQAWAFGADLWRDRSDTKHHQKST